VETSYAPYPSEMGFKSPVLRKVAEMGNKGFKELRYAEEPVLINWQWLIISHFQGANIDAAHLL
jgi:hypothetical protein